MSILRGEFCRGDGLVIPNNITIFGASRILQAAMANVDLDFWVGLVNTAPDPELMIEDTLEPTLGVNGYGRIEIARSAIGWPTNGQVNNESYIESDWLTWLPVGGNFDQAFTRMMLCPFEMLRVGDIIALSNALPEPLILTPATPLGERQFKYRLYLR